MKTSKSLSRRIPLGRVSRSTRGAVTGIFENGGLHNGVFLA
jgi:hypothetical protein